MKQKTKTTHRIDIFGTKFSLVDFKNASLLLRERAHNRSGYVCFTSTGMISRAYKDLSLQKALNNSFLTIIDGKFTEFYARLKGENSIECISGYDLMNDLLQSKLTHYFYGCDKDVLDKLEHALKLKFPDANILGFTAPPVVAVDDIYKCNVIAADIEKINMLNPDIVWIGISSPKQDFLMKHYYKKLKNSIMIGVGAVFLYQAGVISRGPKIYKKLALRWLFRIFQEPKRIMAKKPFHHLAHFVFLIIKYDVFRVKKKYLRNND